MTAEKIYGVFLYREHHIFKPFLKMKYDVLLRELNRGAIVAGGGACT
jgi:hypothetical protein